LYRNSDSFIPYHCTTVVGYEGVAVSSRVLCTEIATPGIWRVLDPLYRSSDSFIPYYRVSNVALVCLTYIYFYSSTHHIAAPSYGYVSHISISVCTTHDVLTCLTHIYFCMHYTLNLIHSHTNKHILSLFRFHPHTDLCLSLFTHTSNATHTHT